MIDREKLKQSIETAERIERVEAEIAEYMKEIERLKAQLKEVEQRFCHASEGIRELSDMAIIAERAGITKEELLSSIADGNIPECVSDVLLDRKNRME